MKTIDYNFPHIHTSNKSRSGCQNDQFACTTKRYCVAQGKFATTQSQLSCAQSSANGGVATSMDNLSIAQVIGEKSVAVTHKPDSSAFATRNGSQSIAFGVNSVATAIYPDSIASIISSDSVVVSDHYAEFITGPNNTAYVLIIRNNDNSIIQVVSGLTGRFNGTLLQISDKQLLRAYTRYKFVDGMLTAVGKI